MAAVRYPQAPRDLRRVPAGTSRRNAPRGPEGVLANAPKRTLSSEDSARNGPAARASSATEAGNFIRAAAQHAR